MSVIGGMSELDRLQSIAATILAILEDAQCHAIWTQDPRLSLSEISDGYEALQSSVGVAQDWIKSASRLIEGS